jgi:hypothetical protein
MSTKCSMWTVSNPSNSLHHPMFSRVGKKSLNDSKRRNNHQSFAWLSSVLVDLVSCILAVASIPRAASSTTLCFRFHPPEDWMLYGTPVLGRRDFMVSPEFDCFVTSQCRQRAKRYQTTNGTTAPAYRGLPSMFGLAVRNNFRVNEAHCHSHEWRIFTSHPNHLSN